MPGSDNDSESDSKGAIPKTQQHSTPAPGPFIAGSDDWAAYQERLEQYFVAQGISNNAQLKKATLISLMGADAYSALRFMVYPNSVNEKSYDELCALLKPHFSEAVVVHYARKEFYKARKAEGETVQQLLLRLKSLASKCAFGANFESILLDKLVFCQEGRVFDRLCEEDEKLSLIQAIKIITRVEGQIKLVASRDAECYAQYSGKRVQRHQAHTGQAENRTKRPVHERLGATEQKRPRCLHCGGKNHPARDCVHKEATCYACNKRGHIATVCPLKKKTTSAMYVAQRSATVPSGKTHVAADPNDHLELYADSDEFSEEEVTTICSITSRCTEDSHFCVPALVNGKQLDFQIDTAAGISAVSDKLYLDKFNDVPLEKPDTHISSYEGARMKLIGMMRVTLNVKNNIIRARVYVVERGGPPILGRAELKRLGYEHGFTKAKEIHQIKEIRKTPSAQQLCDEFADLLDGKLGTYACGKIKLKLKPDSVPKFVKPRPVPFAFQEQYDKEFDALEELGVITPTDASEWGTPVVPVLKPNGKIRICGDYKTTINQHLADVKHPLPRVEEIFSQMKGGKLFTKLDLCRGYNQFVLDDESKKLVALSTHRGVYVMNRMPFGIAPASGIFQREIEKVLRGIPHVVNYLDDILITGIDEEEHSHNIKRVMQRLRKAGLKLNKDKCEFYKSELTYLGYNISRAGLRKCAKNVEAILKAPTPTNVSEVRSFCGLANYYGKFVHNMAGTLSPLYKLLQKGIEFDWSEECEQAFKRIKAAIVSDNILCHFDPELPLVLSCDASNVGIGAVLSHRVNGELKPIAFASRTLSKAESNYSTIHKEGLAIIFGVKKFYQFLIGTRFTLQTDHKPLLAIFKPSNGIPMMAAGRVQRWAEYLKGFEFTIEHVKGEHNVSDLLSRLPLSDANQDDGEEKYEERAFLHFMRDSFPHRTIKHTDIRAESRKDAEISTLINSIQSNSLRQTLQQKPEFRAYLNKESELSVERGILLWGARVVIPRKLRKDMLDSVHSTHMGMVKTKSLCRSYFWWPNLDKDIEAEISACEQCCQLLPDPKRAELIPWRCEEKAWSRIHLDFAGPINGVFLLVIVDAFSKWIEVFTTKSPNAQFTLSKLYETCSRFGFPETIVSDNGVQFTSEKFKAFVDAHDIRHVLTSPGFPATNGQAESAVKVIKKGVKAALNSSSSKDIKQIVNEFLFDYRSTPHTATMESPAKLLLKREVRNRLSLIKPPTIVETMEENQRKQVENHKGTTAREFSIGNQVWARDYTNPNKKGWMMGRIRRVLGRRNYLIEISSSGRCIKRHVDQLRAASPKKDPAETEWHIGHREREMEREVRAAESSPGRAATEQSPRQAPPSPSGTRISTEGPQPTAPASQAESTTRQPEESVEIRQSHPVLVSRHHVSTRVRRKPQRYGVDE